MTARPIVMYLGGFAKVGGIEAFARDFLLALAPAYPARELVIWDEGSRDHPLLNDIIESGVRIARSPWRWGCVWNLPDFLLVPTGLRAILGASAVIFKRPPPRPILGFLRRASRLAGRPITFILIMPYRPLEYWGPRPNPGEYEHFDLITVQSEEGVHDLEKMGYRGRIENIPLLPPKTSASTDFPFATAKDTIRLGFLGRLVPQKNLGYLLEIYRVLTQRSSGLRLELHLFGDGPQRAALEQKCAALSLPNVIFHGEVLRADVARAIDSCDLFLITSLTEGQCLVALEVLSRGRPLVATPVGALPEVLRQSELGRLAPLHDAHAFATRVGEIIDAIRSGQTTPQSVAAAFTVQYDHNFVLNRYLSLLAETASAGGKTAPAVAAPGKVVENESLTPAANPPLTVAIIITTKNRVDELRRTCRVLRQLVPAPLEILITADGCTDDTAAFVKSEMPAARLFVNEPGRGSIAARDHMIRESRADLVLSLDDDSYPQEPACLAQIIALFEQRPPVAVLHFPQCTDEYPQTLPRFDFGAPRPTRSYSSAGAVLRRSTYLQLPGYEPSFFHAYEEPDYALQCVAAGHEIFYTPLVSIRHHYSGTARNEGRTHLRHARNEFWSTLLRCPFPQLLALAPYRIFSQFRYACSRGPGWILREPFWWAQAVPKIPHFLARRRPVSWHDYQRWLRLTDIDYPPVSPRAVRAETGVTASTKTA